MYADVPDGNSRLLNERLAAGLDPNTQLLIPQSGRHLSLLELSLLAANDKAGEALLLAGAESDEESQLLGTPLELAAQQGMLRTLKFLVNQDPMRLSTSPSPPLLLAVGNQHMEVVRFLLQRSADYVRDGLWQTLLDDSLQVAVSTYSESSLDIVVELIRAGADPAPHPTLVEAAAKCSPRLVEVLIEAGADPTMQSKGESPAELALSCVENGDTKSGKVILQHLQAAGVELCHLKLDEVEVSDAATSFIDEVAGCD